MTAKWIWLVLFSLCVAGKLAAQSHKTYFLEAIKCVGVKSVEKKVTRTLVGLILDHLGDDIEEQKNCRDVFNSVGIVRQQWMNADDLGNIRDRLILSRQFESVRLALEKSEQRQHVVLWAHLKEHEQKTSGKFRIETGYDGYKRTSLNIDAQFDFGSQGRDHAPPLRFSLIHHQRLSRPETPVDSVLWPYLSDYERAVAFAPQLSTSLVDLKLFLKRQSSDRVFVAMGGVANGLSDRRDKAYDIYLKSGYEREDWFSIVGLQNLHFVAGIEATYTSYQNIVDTILPMTVETSTASDWVMLLSAYMRVDHDALRGDIKFERAVQEQTSYRIDSKLAAKLWQWGRSGHWITGSFERYHHTLAPEFAMVVSQQKKIAFGYRQQWSSLLFAQPLDVRIDLSRNHFIGPSDLAAAISKVQLSLTWQSRYWQAAFGIFYETERHY